MRLDWDPSRADAFHGARSYGWIWQPRADVLVTRLVGQAELGALQFYIERAEPLLDAGVRLSVFHDWSRLAHYDVEVRDALRHWAAPRHDQFAEVHYLVQSRIVAMAISVAALTLARRLVTHTRADAFEAALDARLEG